MAAEAAQFASLRFSSGDLPERDRIPFWREAVCRKVGNNDVEPLGDRPFAVEAQLHAMPGLRVMRGVGSDIRYDRTRSIIAQGSDGDGQFGIGILLGGRSIFTQRGLEIAAGAGEAVTMSGSEPSAIEHRGPNHIGLAVPLRALAPLVDDIEGRAGQLIPRESEPLRLLVGYLGLLLNDDMTATPELRHVAVAHVHDLIAMSIGATRDGAEVARDRGVQAARLAAVKTDILANLGSRGLSVAEVGLRQRLSPRHLHRLFERDGTTFSEFVLEARLARAHRMLVSSAQASETVTAIAYACGFNDLSYFNRTFRRRYGATPSEVRAESVLH